MEILNSLYEQMLMHRRSGAEALDLRVILTLEDYAKLYPEHTFGMEIILTMDDVPPMVVRLASDCVS